VRRRTEAIARSVVGWLNQIYPETRRDPSIQCCRLANRIVSTGFFSLIAARSR
jgi:hypothetical protein